MRSIKLIALMLIVVFTTTAYAQDAPAKTDKKKEKKAKSEKKGSKTDDKKEDRHKQRLPL